MVMLETTRRFGWLAYSVIKGAGETAQRYEGRRATAGARCACSSLNHKREMVEVTEMPSRER